jgi:hypothetical protein
MTDADSSQEGSTPLVVVAVPVQLGNELVQWLVGQSVDDVKFAEPGSWWLDISGGGAIAAHGGTWRLSTRDRMVASSEDHGHHFGLPAPLDAVDSLRSRIKGALVTESSIRDGAPDLVLRFDSGLVLEVLALSIGYENWEVRDPNGRCIVVHGSRDAATWQDPPSRTQPPSRPTP